MKEYASHKKSGPDLFELPPVSVFSALALATSILLAVFGLNPLIVVIV